MYMIKQLTKEIKSLKMHCLCRPSRIMSVRINLLDETDFIHEIKDDLPGQALLDLVFARLNLIETSYFGIRYIDEENQTHWLDPASRISRQLKPKADPYDLYFGVKFYAADPCKLVEEITRYQLFLQVKQDVLQGRLSVPFELAAELGAFVIQSELGDYDQRRHSKGYVSEFRLLPNQSNEMEIRIAELHQQLKGMSPSAAETNYLDKVKWHEMYGVDLHPVLGEDSVEYYLGLTPSGIVVLRNKTTVAHYYWPRVAKVYYKGRYFMLRISDKNNELSTYGFETPRKPACKHLWRCCVEHHAFFRLLRVQPAISPTSPSNVSDIFQLGSRLKCSKDKSVKDSLFINRSPPAFIRVPSKRQPRRIMDDILNSSKTAEHYASSTLLNKNLSNFNSPYRSTYSIPTSLGINPYHQTSYSQHSVPHSQSNYNNNSGIQTPDSPRSTRSAPWPRSQQRSLFGNKPSSPRSVRSARTTGGGSSGGGHHHHHHHQQQHQHQHHHHQHGNSNSQRQHQQSTQRDHASSSTSHQHRYRSSSVESHSSNDSRSTRRHKHRHRRISDNESELSRGSGRSGRSHHRKHRRSRHRRDSAGSDGGRSYSGHRNSMARSASAAGSTTELIDSSIQWREAQRRQAEASLGQSAVHQASVAKSTLLARSLHSNDSDTHSHHKSRRHRKSPSDSRNRLWNSELAKHLQFGLVDTAGMTEDQLREIPYTVVETTSKRSSSNIRIHKSNSKNSVGGKSTGSGNTLTNGSGSASGQAKNRVDRIRGLCYQNSTPNDSSGTKNGSIRSASTVSSRECERNNGLVRMLSSMSMGDFISPTGSNLSPMENSALRVSHEHTDSGLGAEQDYAYSSERSSDSTRYGTNKSSGASSGSHCKSNGTTHNMVNGHSSTYNSLMQQTVNNHKQQQQHQQQFYISQPQQQQRPSNTFYGQRRNDITPIKLNYCKYTNNPVTTTTTTTTTIPTSSINHLHQQQQHQQQNYVSLNTSTAGNSSVYTVTHCSANVMDKSVNTLSDTPHNKPKSSNHRLLNYTTFENNQYTFSLNNVFGAAKDTCLRGSTNHNNQGGSQECRIKDSKGGGDGFGGLATNPQLDNFVEWPHTPAAPYYYQGPSSVVWQAKKRDAKSDLGVPTRRFSSQQQQQQSFMTKTQLLSGNHLTQMPSSQNSGVAPYASGVLNSRLHPAKSDLFLAYPSIPHDYEPPFIYNYKMPQMPEFLRSPQQQQQHTAYHISGIQTTDTSPNNLYKSNSSSSGSNNSSSNGGSTSLYGGTTPATDVMYYQFDNGKLVPPPIIQQPKSSLHNNIMTTTTTNVTTTTTSSTPVTLTSTSSSLSLSSHNIGPLIFLPISATNASTAITTTTTTTTPVKITTTIINAGQQPTSTNISNSIGNDRNININTNNNINNNNNNNSSSTVLRSTTTTCSDNDLEEIDEEHSNPDDVFYDEYDNQTTDSGNNNNNNNHNINHIHPTTVCNIMQMENEAFKAITTATITTTEKAAMATNVIETNASIITKTEPAAIAAFAAYCNLDNYNANDVMQQKQQQNNYNITTQNANMNAVPPSLSTIITKQPLLCTPNIAFAFTTDDGSTAFALDAINNIYNHNSNNNNNNNKNIPQNNPHIIYPITSTPSSNNSITGKYRIQQQFEHLRTSSLSSSISSIAINAQMPRNPYKYTNAIPQIGLISTNTATTSSSPSSSSISTSASAPLSSSSPSPSPSTSSSLSPASVSAPAECLNPLQNQLKIQNQNQNISSSLEIILSPIIQSSRRAQL